MCEFHEIGCEAMAGTVPASAGLSTKSSLDFDVGGSSISPDFGVPSGEPHGNGNGRRLVHSLVIKAACLAGGAYLLKRLTKTTTRWDHSRIVAQSLSGEKFSTEQAARDPMTYFNLRMLTCPATVLADGARVLYFEQRFFMVKPCPKEMKCDVEVCALEDFSVSRLDSGPQPRVASYAVRDIEEYRNFCDRAKNQRPQPVEIVADMAEHLTTVYLSKCERGRRCLYEGSTPSCGFPNSWFPGDGDRLGTLIGAHDVKLRSLCESDGSGDVRWSDVVNGATRCTSELTIFKTGEIHCWDRAYDDEGNQVWGVRQGPYEFKLSNSSTGGLVSESDFINTLQEDKTLSTFSS